MPTRAAQVGLAALAALLGAVATAADAQATTEVTLAGRTVAVDVYRPAATARGAAILSHGFTRSRTTLGGHAAALAAAGVLALTPDLPYTFDFRRNAQGLAELVGLLRAGGEFGTSVERVVLVGFSAGALSSLLAAATPGVVGYVGLDPFDRVASDGTSALGLDFAPTLRTESVLLRAPPSRCNAQAVAAPWRKALPALLSDRLIDGASHCDFESPTDWMCRVACGDTDPARQQLVRETLMQAIDRWLPRTPAAGRALGERPAPGPPRTDGR
jgi:dienelactone hydrolase